VVTASAVILMSGDGSVSDADMISEKAMRWYIHVISPDNPEKDNI
jgi:hypothetical protein